MLARTLVLLALISPAAGFAQNPFSGIEPGMTANQFRSSAKDVSNPQSWDETAFEVENPHYTLLQQFRASKCTLTFYKNRLSSIGCYYPRAKFEAIYTNIVVQRKAPKDRDWKSRDRSAVWYGEFRDSHFVNSLRIDESGEHAVVTYSDETQKDFRFSDLFKGSLFWVLVALLGLFAGYLLFGWFVTSKCPKCKSRSLAITGKSFTNPQDYNRELLGLPDVHWDEVYHYRCKNCGFEKDDRYSSFWSFRRSQND